MKFTIRLVGAIWLSVMLVVAGFAWLQVREERARLDADLERRALLLGEGLKEAVEPVVARGAPAVDRILKRFGTSRRGIAVYDRLGGLVVATPDVAPVLPPSLPEAFEADARAHGFETRSLWDAAVPLSTELERTVCEYRDRQVDAVQRLIFPIHGM